MRDINDKNKSAERLCFAVCRGKRAQSPQAGILSLDITGLNKAKKKIAQTQAMLESVLFTPPAGL